MQGKKTKTTVRCWPGADARALTLAQSLAEQISAESIDVTAVNEPVCINLTLDQVAVLIAQLTR